MRFIEKLTPGQFLLVWSLLAVMVYLSLKLFFW
jgi:hypothetical protein